MNLFKLTAESTSDATCGQVRSRHCSSRLCDWTVPQLIEEIQTSRETIVRLCDDKILDCYEINPGSRRLHRRVTRESVERFRAGRAIVREHRPIQRTRRRGKQAYATP